MLVHPVSPSRTSYIPDATSISVESLQYLDHEIRFYIHLLKNGLNHGCHPRQSLFYRLLHQLQTLLDEKVAGLHSKIRTSATNNLTPDLQPEVDQLTYELRHLKTQLFPMAGDLISLVIW